jgi:hypothetical protein
MKPMKRILTLSTLLLICTTAAVAQLNDYTKWGFFGGYSALNFDNLGGDTDNATVNDILGEKNTMRGLELATTRNFHNYVGAKFDYSLHLRQDEFSRTAGSGTIDSTVQNFLGGLQFKNNSEDAPRFRPFAPALFGVAV